jgi:hypothetical protein
MIKRSTKKRRRDTNVLAKHIVDIATEQTNLEEQEQLDSTKDPRKTKAGRLGGLKGGKARAEKLSAAQRRAIAKRAAEARWKKTSRESS